MSLYSAITMTTAFVCIKPQNGNLQPKGTAFFVVHQETQQGLQKTQMYVVTAKHVLDKIHEKTALDTIFLTFNGPNGREEVEMRLSDWHFHPKVSTETIDVAVARFNYRTGSIVHYPNPNQVRHWAMNQIATLQVAKRADIDTGHVVGIAGLFVHHQGIQQNIPIIRLGNIAAMPIEKVTTTIGMMDAYLIEVRSVGGLSGSPVFAITKSNNLLLLGLIHGHFDQNRSRNDSSLQDADTYFSEERINSGIAIVVPGDSIRETIQQLIKLDFHS